METDHVVFVAGGPPSIKIEVGGVEKTAAYVSGNGSSGTPLKFEYTILSADADDTAGGITLPENPIVLNGASIRDEAGNDLDATFAAVTGENSLVVDTTVPVVTDESVTVTGSGALNINDVVTMSFNPATVGITDVAQVSFDMSEFGGTSPVVVDAASGGVWQHTFTIQEANVM